MGDQATNSIGGSRDPSDWAPEYRELGATLRSAYPDALRGRSSVPPILELHPGVACPASCTFCPTSGVKLYPPERRRAPLSGEEIRLIVKEFASLGGETVLLSGGLEPLTGPAIAAASAAAEAGMAAHLYTSGLAPVLDGNEGRRDILACVRRVRFSVNGFSEETYGAVQLGARPRPRLLAKVLRRIEALVRDREALRSATSIGVSFVVVPENAHEAAAALEYCDRSGVDFLDVLVDISDDRPVEPEIAPILAALRDRQDAGPLHGVAVRVSGRTGVPPARARLCRAPQVKIAIDPFGLAWRCCHAANPEISSPELLLGDVRTHGLRAVMSSPEARPVRTGCATCPDFERTFNAIAEM